MTPMRTKHDYLARKFHKVSLNEIFFKCMDATEKEAKLQADLEALVEAGCTWSQAEYLYECRSDPADALYSLVQNNKIDASTFKKLTAHLFTTFACAG